jgi:hypothetical protein
MTLTRDFVDCLRRGAVVPLLFLASSAAAHAAPPGTEPGFTLALYGWLAGIDGTVGAPGADLDDGSGSAPTRVDVSLDPDYELKGFMFYGEWRGERWMAFVDSVWANIKQGATIRLAGIGQGIDTDAEVDGNVVTAAVGYRVHESENSALVVYGGARYYDLEVKLNADAALLPVSAKSKSDDSWVDGIVGAKWNYRIGDRWQSTVEGNYGFGESDSSWQIVATLGYDFSWGRLLGGWRHLDIDHSTKTYRLDASMTGPLIGAVFAF